MSEHATGTRAAVLPERECRRCHRPIHRGDRITFLGVAFAGYVKDNYGWVHADCGTPEDSPHLFRDPSRTHD